MNLDSRPTMKAAAPKGPLPMPALIVALVTAAIHIGLDVLYRPWAWRNQVSDFGVADSFTNFTAVIGLSAIMVLSERRRLWADPWLAWLVVFSPVVAMVAYEFLQPLLSWGTFAISDLVATLLGGVVVVLIKLRVYDPAMTRR